MPRGNQASDDALESFLSRNSLKPPPAARGPTFSCYYHVDEEVFPTPEQKAQLAEGTIVGLAHISCFFRSKEAAER